MRTLRRFLVRVQALFLRHRMDADCAAEINSHVAMIEDELRRQGMSPTEARREARLKMGGIEQARELHHEARTFAWFESLVQDVRFALRMLRKNPGFTMVAVLTLALGIGANTAIFSMVNGVLLRPLPYPEPERLVRIWETKPGSPRNVINPVNFLDWHDQTHSFEAMATVDGADANIRANGEPMAVSALRVSTDFFSVLRTPPYLGRTFVAADGMPGQNHVTILSYRLWREQFDGDPSIIGRRSDVDGAPYVVIGVMPESFSFPGLKPQLFTPDALVRDQSSEGGRYLTAIARLKPGVTFDEAQRDIANVARTTERLRPKFNQGWSATVIPMLEDATEDVRRPLWVLFAAVGFVLLVACANLANLLLMRGTARLRELAVRSALGATRSRIIRQLLVESLFLSLAGMGAGLLLGLVGLHGLLGLIPASLALPRTESIVIDSRVLIFTCATTLATAVVAGLVPALRLSGSDPQKALALGSQRSSVGAGQLRILRLFVVAEMTLALLLTIGAGLMLRSFVRLISVNPGFNTTNLISMHIWTAPSRYNDNQKRSQYFGQLLERIRNTPGVESAGSIHFLPLTDRTSGSCFDSVEQPPPDVNSPGARFLVVSSDYFKTVGTTVLEGREFTDQDSIGRPSVAIVNHAFVQKFSPKQDAVDREYNVCWTVKNPVRIVGVVADARQTALDDDAPEPTMFISNAQAPMYFASIVVRTFGDPRQVTRDVEAAIHRVDPDQAISDVQNMTDVFSESVAAPRFQTVLLLIFAGLALLLAVVGIYGVMSNSVSQRTREIGIRVALGASASEVARMVLLEAISLGTVAVAMGILAALGLTRLLESLLFETSPTDVTTLVIGSIGVLVVATFSAVLPARRAMQVDPMVALRHE